MKFHWFAEVSYPGLPTEHNGQPYSTWVDTPIEFADSRTVGDTYRMFLRLMQQADRQGFDGLAVNEHHQTPFAMTPSPNLLAASLATSTDNAAILIIGDSLVNYNPPLRVAEEMAYLDCLSDGRLIAGFVFGTPQDSAVAYGNIPVLVRDKFHEARELILRAWEAQEPFAFNGRYSQHRYVNVWPKPVQSRPPVWVPGSGSIETWDLVTKENYCYGQLSFSGLHAAKPTVDAYWEYVAGCGGDMNPHRMAFTQLICTADTDAEAEAKYYDAVRYFNRIRNPQPHFLDVPGYTTPASLKSMNSLMKKGASKLTPEDQKRAARGEMPFWEMDEKGFIIAGSPERVEQRIRELATELRIGQLITCLHMGDLPEETAAHNTHLFATKVAPKLRNLWEDEPDHWTPQVHDAPQVVQEKGA